MSNNINNFNWSATNTSATTVQWEDKQHWSADQLSQSGRITFLRGQFPSGTDPGGGGGVPGGQNPPPPSFGGPPKHHKQWKNVTRAHEKAAF